MELNEANDTIDGLKLENDRLKEELKEHAKCGARIAELEHEATTGAAGAGAAVAELEKLRKQVKVAVTGVAVTGAVPY